MNKSIDINLLLQKIKELENNQKNSRNINENDLKKNLKKYEKQKELKVKEYRMQEEHGEKKFIKP